MDGRRMRGRWGLTRTRARMLRPPTPHDATPLTPHAIDPQTSRRARAEARHAGPRPQRRAGRAAMRARHSRGLPTVLRWMPRILRMTQILQTQKILQTTPRSARTLRAQRTSRRTTARASAVAATGGIQTEIEIQIEMVRGPTTPRRMPGGSDRRCARRTAGENCRTDFLAENWRATPARGYGRRARLRGPAWEAAPSRRRQWSAQRMPTSAPMIVQTRCAWKTPLRRRRPGGTNRRAQVESSELSPHHAR
ncbi:hypothetical protein C8J57DRAFT_1275907 [Mycena rebaudengoi]|nr:hypothetical protein C8J57DRAFT_1275907 [Mycena rebaudengoi]